jgi:mRNA interferase RelE/StbE
MSTTINYTETAKRELKKLDKPVARRILDFLDNRDAIQDDTRHLGKALTGVLGALWRCRVGDNRVICDIQPLTVTVLVLRVGHRREIYR